MKTERELRRERRIGLIVSITLASLGVVAWLTLKFVLGFSRVGASSMAPTIHRGDRVSVNRAAYRFGGKPRVGDVASYRALQGELFLHRIVGGPGDTVELRDNVLFRNGKRIDEPYIMVTPDVAAVRSFGPIEVPPGHYFFLGDNRDNANDSRYQGFTEEKDIRGRMGYVLHIGDCDGAN
ncbi:MAG TPA: signal peptidase I [Thermoanaerobaculia bacterium]|jgi:signal peptidase I